jgi:hypothetical protein
VFSPVNALLTARRTPELERVQAELGARTSFREAARILEILLPALPANHESVRNRTHAVALRLEAADRQAAATVAVEDTATATAEASRPIVMLDESMQNRGGCSSLGYVAGPQTGRGRAKGDTVGEAGDGAAAAQRGDGNQPPRLCMLSCDGSTCS